ncbi:conserved hypothetical protein [Hyphomonas neptunium ATCC 15444]|uniref:DUF917 domain-containing protein n=2 Tax=Hyphomonas TaxID=85 RepID=Q0BZ95_HYPNA|nr:MULTISPECIES: DUF917 domain-containing protein [Hyphomonas]ABI78706.1 conserved hypothetical protein [Hyphomonas neptunium ATCC 15444]KCZ95287.1 hypothetical protein HHI_06439 [Hyphomonas hirschiana VP5]
MAQTPSLPRSLAVSGHTSGDELVLSAADLHDFARGAAFLGTGGGGDPYIGRLMAQNAIREFGHPKIISPEALADDATVAFVAMLGAPTVLNEKAASGADIDLAVTRLAERLGRPIDALMPAEIGGVNSAVPIVAAARLGIPLLNADGMGRAFPEIQMVVMNFEGIRATPFVIVDEHLNSVIVETGSARRAEEFVRSVAINMGLSCIVAGYPMTGAEAKRATVTGTLTEALEIGRAIEAGRKAGDAVGALVRRLSESAIYGHACDLFDGKIVDLRRETTAGFSMGHCRIVSLTDPSRTMDIQFQNENLVALENGAVKAIVPDLITIVDRETAEPIPTEALRYGQRVKVIAAAAPRLLTTPQALEYVHPRCFGLDFDFTPLVKPAD